MIRNPLRSLRASHAIAAVALVAACSGTSYAAATIGSGQIVDNSLRSIDVRDDTLRSVDVRDGSLQEQDLSAATRSALRTTHVVEGTAVQVAGGALGTGTVMCDFAHGWRATGGGGYSYHAGKGYLTKSTVVYGQGDYQNQPVGWEVEMQNLLGSTNYVIVRAMCAKS